jgi:hypothetical protein
VVYTTTQSSYVFNHYLPNGSHTWAVQVVDEAGNRSDWVLDTFVTDQVHIWLPVAMRGQ